MGEVSLTLSRILAEKDPITSCRIGQMVLVFDNNARVQGPALAEDLVTMLRFLKSKSQGRCDLVELSAKTNGFGPASTMRTVKMLVTMQPNSSSVASLQGLLDGCVTALSSAIVDFQSEVILLSRQYNHLIPSNPSLYSCTEVKWISNSSCCSSGSVCCPSESVPVIGNTIANSHCRKSVLFSKHLLI